MKIKYNQVALPLLIKVGTKHFINISYDRYNRIDGWTWNEISEEYKYNRQGLVEEVKARGAVTKYTYNDWNKVSCSCKLSITCLRTTIYTVLGS